jgi:Fe-S-cluster containining protein
MEFFFSCTQCGVCCKGFGGTFVSEEDIAAIGQFLNLQPEQVQNEYCVKSGQSLVVAQRRNGFCIFWDGNCTIHPVKPHMCRQWPFISALRIDPFNWKIMADMCPGMHRNVNPDQLLSYLDCIDIL